MVCGLILMESKKTAEVQELLGLKPVSLVVKFHMLSSLLTYLHILP